MKKILEKTIKNVQSLMRKCGLKYIVIMPDVIVKVPFDKDT